MTLVKIEISELNELKEFYKIDWPLHIVTFNTIESFKSRFDKFPEWKEKVLFWSLRGGWRSHATFVMINTHTNSIFFNTLETEPHNEIKAMLTMIDYTQAMMFLNVRYIFQDLVKSVIDKFRLNVVYESICDCFVLPKQLFKDVKIEAPEGYHLAPLSQKHARMINSHWIYQKYFPSTEQIVESCIEHNVNFGVFNRSQDLVAWTIAYDNGAMGFGNVVESERQKSLMSTVFTAVAAKIVTDFDSDVYYWVEHGNQIPEAIMKSLNLVPFDVHIFIVVNRNEASTGLQSHI